MPGRSHAPSSLQAPREVTTTCDASLFAGRTPLHESFDIDPKTTQNLL